MSFGWPTRLRLILTLFLILTASPLASAMDTGTPAPPPETPIEEPAPTDEAPPNPEPTTEPDPTEPPVVPTEVPPTVAPTTEPDPTAVPTDEPEAPATDELESVETPDPPAESRSVAPDMSATQNESGLFAIVQQCEDDTRVGQFEFLPIDLFSIASDTGQNCQELDPSLSGSITVSPGNGVPGYTQEFSGSDGFIVPIGPIPSGAFTISITIGDHTGTSAEFTLQPNAPLFLPIYYFVAETAPQEPVEGLGSIAVTQFLCEDTTRVGSSDFYVDSLLSAQSTATNCIPAPDVPGSGFVLTDPDNEDWVVGPLFPTNGVTRFDTVPAGTYQVTEYGTRSISAPFVVSGGETLSILAVTYVDQLPGSSTDVFIEKIYCEDNERAGTTEFTLDTPTSFGPMAESATCFAEPPGERPEITVTLDNVDTEDSFRTTLGNWGQAWIDDVPAGTYTVTESGDSVGTVTSDPMYISGPTDPRIRIINYIEEADRPDPGEEGEGHIEGFVLFCSAPDRAEGDVDFIILEGMTPFAVTECDVVSNATASFVLYEVDGDTQEIIEGTGIPVETDAFAEFWLDDIPAGYYTLVYVSPDGVTEVRSDTFVVQPDSTTFFEVNIFAAPVYLGSVEIWKDFCVDPERAGDASFSVISEFGGSEFTTTAATDCRFSGVGDGPFAWTLTNVDTGRTWTSEATEPGFGGIPGGTYTLTETWNGTTHTSDAFSFDPSREDLSVYVRNYIAEHDWDPGEGTENPWLDIWAYICADPNRDEGAEFFVFGDPNDESGTGEGVNNETSRCRAASEIDGLTFEAVPQDGEGEPIGFVLRGNGWFEPDNGTVPAGEYIVTESTTGATTGLIRVTSDTYVEFYRYEPLPRSEVTINVSSTAPEVANVLPEDATWTVTLEDGTPVGSDTFAPEHLELPQSIDVTDLVPYGTYVVTVDAGPTFEPYGPVTFSVDQPEQTFNVELVPVTASAVTVNISSLDPEIANTLPADATWSVALTDGTPVDSDTFAPEHLELPQSIDVTAPVPFGTYEITVNAGPVFLTYTSLVTVQELSQTVEVVLIPVETPTAPVELSITSADLDIADRLPEGATWTITSVDNQDQTMTMAFTDDQLDLPVTIPVDTMVPYGDYIVTIDAGPTFEPYSETFTVGGDDETANTMTRQGFFALQQAPVAFEIVLQPADVDPTPEPTVTPDPTVTPEPTEPATPDEPDTDKTEKPKPGTTVTSLPSTGQGAASTSIGTILMLTTVAAALAIAGGVVTRRTHA